MGLAKLCDSFALNACASAGPDGIGYSRARGIVPLLDEIRGFFCGLVFWYLLG